MSAPTRPRHRGDRPRLALVLSGGGARGAYEAGVVRYIREDLAGDLGGQVRFDIISGTSVGGIHACFFAGTADMADKQGRMLCDRWESFVLEEMVAFGVKEFLRAPATLLGGGKIEEVEGQRRLGGIVQTRQLERVVRRLIPWQRISANCKQGYLESLSVTATDIGSGKTVVFVERADGQLPQWSKDPFVRAQAVTMGAEHALASAALPILFPAVAVGERFFCDGGLRQNTPLSPALRLGADKVLVIGLRHKPKVHDDAVPEESMPFPGAAFLVGKVLDAFLLDHIDYDLDRLRRFNALIQAVRTLGTEDGKRFDEVVTKMRGAPYRIVEEFMIRPSADLGEIAGRIARTGRFKGSGGGTGIQLLRRLATARGGDEADLLSYILFDGHYAAEVSRLGYEDARAQHDELAKFLADSVVHD
ncbi:MAG TPA: patatin-like phospholipase family protein [Polyangia bacterium]|jgi:NTE family protein|nr:patatin-like phospholipase family protein [Polyangia bacterium]